jgi:hypothetical protein
MPRYPLRPTKKKESQGASFPIKPCAGTVRHCCCCRPHRSPRGRCTNFNAPVDAAHNGARLRTARRSAAVAAAMNCARLQLPTDERRNDHMAASVLSA